MAVVRRDNGHRDSYYVDGNTVRRVTEAPERPSRKRKVSAETRKNREKALQMNLGYVLFLTAAAVLTVAVCVNYLKLQSACTTLQKQETALETTLSEIKLENDATENRIYSSVNLENVKEVAMEKLGMVYATASQIETYEAADGDFVKQYQDVPE